MCVASIKLKLREFYDENATYYVVFLITANASFIGTPQPCTLARATVGTTSSREQVIKHLLPP